MALLAKGVDGTNSCPIKTSNGHPNLDHYGAMAAATMYVSDLTPELQKLDSLAFIFAHRI